MERRVGKGAIFAPCPPYRAMRNLNLSALSIDRRPLKKGSYPGRIDTCSYELRCQNAIIVSHLCTPAWLRSNQILRPFLQATTMRMNRLSAWGDFDEGFVNFSILGSGLYLNLREL